MSKRTLQIVLFRADVEQLERGDAVTLDWSNHVGGDPFMPKLVTIIPEGPGFTPPQQFKACSSCDRPALCQTILAGTQPCVHPKAPSSCPNFPE